MATEEMHEWVHRVLGIDRAPPAGAPLGKAAPETANVAGTVAFAKLRLEWVASRGKLERDLETLRGAMQDYYKDDAVGRRLDKAYQARVKPMLQTLDQGLADALDAARNATDPALREKLVQETREHVRDYRDYIAADPLFQNLDRNPFVELSTGKTLSAMLSTLAQAIR